MSNLSNLRIQLIVNQLITEIVPGAGIEPARTHIHRFLRPTRLPIPPPGQVDDKGIIKSFILRPDVIQLLKFVSD